LLELVKDRRILEKLSDSQLESAAFVLAASGNQKALWNPIFIKRLHSESWYNLIKAESGTIFLAFKLVVNKLSDKQLESLVFDYILPKKDVELYYPLVMKRLNPEKFKSVVVELLHREDLDAAYQIVLDPNLYKKLDNPTAEILIEKLTRPPKYTSFLTAPFLAKRYVLQKLEPRFWKDLIEMLLKEGLETPVHLMKQDQLRNYIDPTGMHWFMNLILYLPTEKEEYIEAVAWDKKMSSDDWYHYLLRFIDGQKSEIASFMLEHPKIGGQLSAPQRATASFKLLGHAKMDPKLVAQSVTQLVKSSPGALLSKLDKQFRLQRSLPPPRRNKKISGSLVQPFFRPGLQVARQRARPSFRFAPL
jgi:hypothetical protein